MLMLMWGNGTMRLHFPVILSQVRNTKFEKVSEFEKWDSARAKFRKNRTSLRQQNVSLLDAIITYVTWILIMTHYGTNHFVIFVHLRSLIKRWKSTLKVLNHYLKVLRYLSHWKIIFCLSDNESSDFPRFFVPICLYFSVRREGNTLGLFIGMLA